MKKTFYFYFAIGLLLGSILFVSCGKKDDKEHGAPGTEDYYDRDQYGNIIINPYNFPDVAFRVYLYDTYGVGGVITHADIEKATKIDVSNKGIKDLSGIEIFFKLDSLLCYGNQITSLDLSKFSLLTHLDCSTNQLTSLDLSKNASLTGLLCYENKLTSLDVSQNMVLTECDCSANQLTSLSMKHNGFLTQLDCSANQLTSLDVSDNEMLTYLDCSANKLSALDVFMNPYLIELECSDNDITFLDLTNNSELNVFHYDEDEVEVIGWPK